VAHISARARTLKQQSCRVIIAGDVNSDFNRRGQSYTDPDGSVHRAQNDIRRCRALTKLVADVGMVRVDLAEHLKNTPTRNIALGGKWHIDMIAVDDGFKHANVTIHQAHYLTVMSDHYPITADLEVDFVKPTKRPDRYVYKSSNATTDQWAKAVKKVEKMLCALEEPLLGRLNAMNSAAKPDQQKRANEVIADLNAVLHTSFRKSIGTKKVSASTNPGWNPGLNKFRKRIRRKQRELRDAHSHLEEGRETDPRDLASLRADMRRHLRRLTRASFKESLARAVGQTGKSKQIWRAINSVKGSNVESAEGFTTCTWDSREYAGKTNVKRALTKRMRVIHGHDGSKPCDVSFYNEITEAVPALAAENPVSGALNAPFSQKEFSQALKKLTGRDSKSTEPDGIHYWMIRRGGRAFHNLLLSLLNKLWEWEIIPAEWLTANVRYLHKGKRKPKADLDSYRPISLLSCLGKFFTMMWYPRLISVLRPHIGEDQAGGLPGDSAVDALWTLQASTAKYASQKSGNHAHMLLCDVEKAFDGVWRDGLYFLLYSYGVRGKMLRMVMNWHSGARGIGLWYDVQTAAVPFTQGVRQGCVLGPLLYITFASALTNVAPPPNGHARPDLLHKAFEDNLSSSEYGLELMIKFSNGAVVHMAAKLYLDDTTLLAKSNAHMQETANAYLAHAHKWRFNLHLGKFQYMVCKRGNHAGTSLLMQDGPNAVRVEPVSEVQLLGVTLDSTFSGAPAVQGWQAESAQNLPLIKSVRQHLGKDWAIHALAAKVEPKVFYGSEAVWATDARITKLDSSCTIPSLKTAMQVPRWENGKAVTYDVPLPWVSTRVTMAQTRQFLRMAWSDNTQRRLLLTDSVHPAAHTAIKRYVARVSKGLRPLGLDPSTVLGAGTPSRNVRKALKRKLSSAANAAQTHTLTQGLRELAEAKPSGRSSLSILAKTAQPLLRADGAQEYAEAERLNCIPSRLGRKVVRAIKTGSSTAKRENLKFSARGNSTTNDECSCCPGVVQDHEHLILECPLTNARRSHVWEALVHGKCHSHYVRNALCGLSRDKALLASLGGKASASPNSKSMRALMAFAAPIWAKHFGDLLK